MGNERLGADAFVRWSGMKTTRKQDQQHFDRCAAEFISFAKRKRNEPKKRAFPEGASLLID